MAKATREQSWRPVSPSWQDAKNQITAFVYDDRNRLISTTDPLAKVETYEYDGNDNLTKRTTPKLDQITFTYDAVNQLLSKTLPGTLVTSYSYSPVGNLLTVTDLDSALTMTYDQSNRLLTTSTAGSSNQPATTLTYTYDKNGNRLTAVDPTGTNTYVYDVLNRLTGLTAPAGGFTLNYDALSRRTSLTLPNGTQTTYTYDPASQVTQILHQLTATSTQINEADYLYNGVGNRTSLTDRRGPQAFGYDTLDRLTSASHPLLATPQAFAYDPVGNRTTGGSVVNADNQLTADANYTYQYDDNGNLTRKTLLATGTLTQYTYDAENRLTKGEDFVAGNPTPTATSTYRYDGLGRRIEKVGNGITRRYVYDGEDILLEYDGANVLQARYTHGPGIDEPIAVTKGSSTYFYHQDGLGTVTDLTDSAGATAKSYAYDAYGTIVDQTGTVDQPYTYTGRELDSESGLYFLRMRMYDPLIGRFSQNDPRGFNGRQLNLYQYNYNEPMDFTDPSGGIPRGLSKPVDPFKDPSRVAYACAQKVVKTVWADAKTQGWRGNDKRVHCVVSCVATKKCGAGVAFGAGVGREAGQLFIQGKILSWNDGIVPSACPVEDLGSTHQLGSPYLSRLSGLDRDSVIVDTRFFLSSIRFFGQNLLIEPAADTPCRTIHVCCALSPS